MGCDIHLHAEVKIDYDLILPGRMGSGEKMPLRWEHYAQISVPRNYDLFARMAGVRNYRGIEPMAEPRGLPEDISGVTLFDWLRGAVDWHTPSWLSSKEIAALEDWADVTLRPSIRSSHLNRWDLEYETGIYLFGNSFAGFEKYPDDRPSGLVDIRFVFWFDN